MSFFSVSAAGYVHGCADNVKLSQYETKLINAMAL